MERQRIAVELLDADGRVVAADWLRHGRSPGQVLAGLLADVGVAPDGDGPARAPTPASVTSELVDVPAAQAVPWSAPVRLHRIALQYPAPSEAPVRPLAVVRPDARAGLDGLDDARHRSLHAGHGVAGDGTMLVQRAACYALVRDAGRVLLTRLRRIGRWSLPGGGVDHGEHPDQAVRREVFEESGFHLHDVRLAGVDTARWTGRAPDGVLEDFHTVFVLYTGTAPTGGRPRVVEVDGSTVEAAWIPETDLPALPLTRAAVSGLRRVGLAPGQDPRP